jgi:acyl-CoA thioesterase-1
MKTKREMKTTSCHKHTARLFVLTLLSVLGACGGAAPTTGMAPVPVSPAVAQVKAGTWVVMGSSTASGTGATQGKAWVSLLAATYSTRGTLIANLAKGGNVSYHGLSSTSAPVANRPAPDLAHNIDEALNRKPVLLIISYPTNDTTLGYTVDETVSNILAIRAQALAVRVPVVVLSTQPRNLDVEKLGRLQIIDQRLAAELGPCLAEVNKLLAGSDGRLSPRYDSGDGAHPNNAGHALIAGQVENLIKSERCVRLEN